MREPDLNLCPSNLLTLGENREATMSYMAELLNLLLNFLCMAQSSRRFGRQSFQPCKKLSSKMKKNLAWNLTPFVYSEKIPRKAAKILSLKRELKEILKRPF